METDDTADTVASLVRLSAWAVLLFGLSAFATFARDRPAWFVKLLVIAWGTALVTSLLTLDLVLGQGGPDSFLAPAMRVAAAIGAVAYLLLSSNFWATMGRSRQVTRVLLTFLGLQLATKQSVEGAVSAIGFWPYSINR